MKRLGSIKDYKKSIAETLASNDEREFHAYCKEISKRFYEKMKSDSKNFENEVNIQKEAIIGNPVHVKYYIDTIGTLIEKDGKTGLWYPDYYKSLAHAIFHENLGWAGLAEWFSEKHAESSSAKIIGENIFFMESGRMVLKPQKISADRMGQLQKALLLLTPKESTSKDEHEVYMRDGTRVTMYKGNLVKQGQDAIVFRRYIIPEYTFEEQERRKTIPPESIPLFLAMIQCGYNVVFTGAVRTAKTTFLSTWQRYEDPTLEGILVETDPEIQMHKIMPQSPIVQMLADGESMKRVTKHIMRSDADYAIMAEARDGEALRLVVQLADKGTRRMKTTMHLRHPEDFCFELANEIVMHVGIGEVKPMIRKVAKSFDYLFHFVQLTDKSQKRLNGIYEISYDQQNDMPVMTQICKYIKHAEKWEWYAHIAQRQRKDGLEENKAAFREFEKILVQLAKAPKEGD